MNVSDGNMQSIQANPLTDRAIITAGSDVSSHKKENRFLGSSCVRSYLHILSRVN